MCCGNGPHAARLNERDSLFSATTPAVPLFVTTVVKDARCVHLENSRNLQVFQASVRRRRRASENTNGSVASLTKPHSVRGEKPGAVRWSPLCQSSLFVTPLAQSDFQGFVWGFRSAVRLSKPPASPLHQLISTIKALHARHLSIAASFELTTHERNFDKPEKWPCGHPHQERRNPTAWCAVN